MNKEYYINKALHWLKTSECPDKKSAIKAIKFIIKQEDKTIECEDKKIKIDYYRLKHAKEILKGLQLIKDDFFSNKNKDISKAREHSLAKETGGKTTPGSGNKWFEKSDAYSKYFRYEDKFTHKNKYSIKLAELKKIEKEAMLTSKIPVLRFGFHKLKHNYVIINNKHFYDSGIERDIKGIDIIGKSYTIDSDYLNHLYLSSNNVILLILHWNDELYYILRYESFLDNIEKFYDIF